MLLQLTKDEIPIYGKNAFYVPIHPKLLKDGLTFDPSLASKVFPQVAKEWYSDLEEHVATTKLEEATRDWYESVFLKSKPVIVKEGKYQKINHLGWRDELVIDERGFAWGLGINRNGGGSLYFREGDQNCENYIPLSGKPNKFFSISSQKAKALSREVIGEDLGRIHVYAHHNIDHYPGALFLRNWAIEYLNEAMRSINIQI
mgnify:CR=1 FL=1